MRGPTGDSQSWDMMMMIRCKEVREVKAFERSEARL